MQPWHWFLLMVSVLGAPLAAQDLGRPAHGTLVIEVLDPQHSGRLAERHGGWVRVYALQGADTGAIVTMDPIHGAPSQRLHLYSGAYRVVAGRRGEGWIPATDTVHLAVARTDTVRLAPTRLGSTGPAGVLVPKRDTISLIRQPH